jgi:hypothetical protein
MPRKALSADDSRNHESESESSEQSAVRGPGEEELGSVPPASAGALLDAAWEIGPGTSAPALHPPRVPLETLGTDGGGRTDSGWNPGTTVSLALMPAGLPLRYSREQRGDRRASCKLVPTAIKGHVD